MIKDSYIPRTRVSQKLREETVLCAKHKNMNLGEYVRLSLEEKNQKIKEEMKVKKVIIFDEKINCYKLRNSKFDGTEVQRWRGDSVEYDDFVLASEGGSSYLFGSRRRDDWPWYGYLLSDREVAKLRKIDEYEKIKKEFQECEMCSI